MRKKSKLERQELLYKRSSLERILICVFSTLIIAFFFWMARAPVERSFPDSGQPTEMYSTETQDDLSAIFSKSIGEAKKSVILTIYTLKSSKIINALKKKSEEGCFVKVICDATESSHLKGRLGKKVKLVQRYMNGFMHQKILIIDKKQTWLGSANMTTDSLRYYGNLVNAIESEPLAAFATEKAESLGQRERHKLFPHQIFSVGGQRLELWFLPDDSAAVERIKQLIHSAQKTIKIAMFAWTRRDFAEAVIAAKKRGIDVKITIDKGMAGGINAKIVNLLQQNGIVVKLSQGTALLHHKFMYVDSNLLVNGSANWTANAFAKNDDCFIVLHELTEKQKAFMDRMWHIIDTDSLAKSP